jgi:RecA-family ATPase
MEKTKEPQQGAKGAHTAQKMSVETLLQDVNQTQREITLQIAKELNKPQTGYKLAEAFFSAFEVVEEDEQDEIKNTLTTSSGGGILPLGDISAVTGLAKSGKSTFVSVLLSSVLGSDRFGLSTQDTGAKVLYIDTEQHKRNVAKVRKRILQIAPTGANERLKMIALRELTPQQQANSIAMAVGYYQPQIVVIDGIVDLIDDFNNIEQSRRIVKHLLQVASTYNCHIINVLHTNKSQEVTGVANMRGHLGAILGNKCSECWSVKKDGNVFTSTLTQARNVDDGEKITYTISNGELTTAEEAIREAKEAKEDEKRAQKLSELREIFKGDISLTYTEIVSRIMEVQDRNEKGAKNYFTRSIKQYLNKSQNDGYIINL